MFIDIMVATMAATQPSRLSRATTLFLLVSSCGMVTVLCANICVSSGFRQAECVIY